MPNSPPDASHDQLTGWKEIAAHLGKSVRTVQRWEQRYDLPVHRVPGSADVVLASKAEVDRWKRSEASLEIVDLDRPDLPTAYPPQSEAPTSVRHRSLRIVVVALAVLLFAILLVHLARLGNLVRRAAEEDDATLFEDRPIALTWGLMEGHPSPHRQPDGFLVDPGFTTAEGGALVFHYVKGGGGGRARPYALAPLRPAPESPRLRFHYTPHADARVSHWAGFSDDTAFVRRGEESIGYWVPQRGIALRLDRTNNAHVNSRASLWVFDGGEPHMIGTEEPLRFQLDPGNFYDCTLEVDGWRVTATVSDGARITPLVGTLASPIRAAAVFIADAHDGVSSASPTGAYDMRFANITVRDAVYKLDIMLRTAAAASPRTLTLGIVSNRTIDADELEEASLRASGASVLAGRSRQGFACRSEDISGDGVLDLVCDFDAQALQPHQGGRELSVHGRTTDGRRVAGRLPLPRSAFD